MLSSTCSGVGNPAVHTYEVFENDSLVTSSNSPIPWSRPLSTAGVFLFKCVVKNILGTAMSTATVTVNGETFFCSKTERAVIAEAPFIWCREPEINSPRQHYGTFV